MQYVATWRHEVVQVRIQRGVRKPTGYNKRPEGTCRWGNNESCPLERRVLRERRRSLRGKWSQSTLPPSVRAATLAARRAAGTKWQRARGRNAPARRLDPGRFRRRAGAKRPREAHSHAKRQTSSHAMADTRLTTSQRLHELQSAARVQLASPTLESGFECPEVETRAFERKWHCRWAWLVTPVRMCELDEQDG